MGWMVLSPDIASSLVKAACVLHNFLAKPNDPLVQSMEAKLNAELENERHERKEQKFAKKHEDDAGLIPILPLPGYHTGQEARQTCNLFATYFHSAEGYIPWQDKSTCVTDLPDQWVTKCNCTAKDGIQTRYCKNFQNLFLFCTWNLCHALSGKIHILENGMLWVISPDPSIWKVGGGHFVAYPIKKMQHHLHAHLEH